MPWLVGLLIVAALLIVPFVLGNYVARKFRMPDHGWKIGLVLCMLASGIVVTTFGWPPKLGIDLSGGVNLVYEVDQAKKIDDRTLRKDEMERLIEAVSRRVNPGGVKEITVRQIGIEQIEITIPYVDEAEAKRIESDVSRAGTLEFRILANNRDHKSLIERAEAENTKVIRDSDGHELGRWVPVDPTQLASFETYSEIARRTRPVGEKEIREILVVKDDYDVTGGYLRQATPGADQRGMPCVNFSFNSAGARLFGGLTGANTPDKVQEFTRKLGIILDGELYSAPSIQSAIFDRGEISGTFTKEEVRSLVNVLNAGALPTALATEPLRRNLVGPDLGMDTIIRGSWAIGISMVLVLLFMPLYYRFSGIVASLALLMTLVLVLAIMITIKAAFSLPGLAGLVLTVGMAVDANVLIFERIREEITRGAALRMAIRNGFGRATTTIVDANLTTLITATVLWTIGTEQIKGFAVILWLGVVMSMYTAIFCSRVVFDVAEKRRWITQLKMMRIVGETNINFLGMRRPAAAVSIVVIAIGLAAVAARGKGLLDIDFTGGVSVEVLFKQPQKTAEVRDKLERLPDLTIKEVRIQDERPSVRFELNTSQKPLVDEKTGKTAQTAIDFVEQHLHDVFGNTLDSNSFTVTELTEIEPATGPAEEPATEAAVPEKPATEVPAKPPGTDQSRRDLPSDTWLALADGTPLELAQADAPAVEPAAKPAEAASEEPAAEPAKKPSEEPVAEPAATVRVDPFVGGSRAKLTFKEKVDHDTVVAMFVRKYGSEEAVPLLELSNPGYEEGSNVACDVWDVKIKLPPAEAEKALASVEKALEDTPHFPSSNTIGGKVAGSTRTLAITALVASLLCIVGYIWIRFQRVVFGLAAVIALVHDVLITLGVIALSYWLAPFLGVLLIDPFKISLSVLAAFLTIIGYSLNDTIVVFDRIREVRGKSPRLTAGMINSSINQTLGRTLLTSLTTLLVVVVLYIGGGQGIHAFAFALVVGVLVGTYSSVFVASPVLLWMIGSTESGAES